MIQISKSLANRLVSLLSQFTPTSDDITERLEQQRKVKLAIKQLDKKIKSEVPMMESGVTVSSRVTD